MLAAFADGEWFFISNYYIGNAHACGICRCKKPNQHSNTCRNLFNCVPIQQKKLFTTK